MSNVSKNYSSLIQTFIVALIAASGLQISSAYAGACSPGIPCTGYDIYSNTTAGTDASFNGPKAGASWNSGTGAYNNTACDGNFMNQIYSKAYMEASRETIMAEQIIHKPDSVLEYTCFDQYIAMAAHNAGTFTESTNWQNLDVALWTGDDNSASAEIPPNDSSGGSTYRINVSFPNTQVDNALRTLLLSSLANYINNNFNHTFMGESITLDNNLNTSSIGGNSYNCSHMSSVWNVARCIDFGEDDRFRSFEHLVSFDPRSIPQECSPGNTSSDTVTAGSSGTKLDNTSSGDTALLGNRMPGDEPASILGGDINSNCVAAGGTTAGVNTTFSNDMIRVANNCDDGTNLNAYSSFDILDTHSDLIKGFGAHLPGVANTTGVVICGSPIPTHVPIITYTYNNTLGPHPLNGSVRQVQNRQMFLHYDHVCTNPGCYYQPIKTPYIYGAPIVSPTTVPAGVCLPLIP